MESSIRVFFLHRYELLVEVLTACLRDHPLVSVVGTAHNLDEAKKKWHLDEVDVLLIDAAFDRNQKRSLVRTISWLRPRLKVVPLGVESEQEIAELIEAGASGYVPLEASLAGFAETLRAVCAGKPPCAPRVAAVLADRMVTLGRQNDEAPSSSLPLGFRLTRREREVLELLAKGLRNKEIAKEFGISLATVKVHVHHLLEKFEVHDRRDAVRRAYETGLLELPPGSPGLRSS
ncbi:MAG: response regulator transcription factor [bacterium]|nr:response regulator transcription factor [bacterium]